MCQLILALECSRQGQLNRRGLVTNNPGVIIANLFRLPLTPLPLLLESLLTECHPYNKFTDQCVLFSEIIATPSYNICTASLFTLSCIIANSSTISHSNPPFYSCLVHYGTFDLFQSLFTVHPYNT